MDPFDLLGLPARLDLDAGMIERAYLARAASLHPDHAGEEGVEAAAGLNEAREVLSDPLRRARALVERLGGGREAATEALPDGFLEVIMEARLEVEEVMASSDEEGVSRWKAWAREHAASRASSVSVHLARGDYRAVGVELNAWKMIQRLIDALEGRGHP